MTAHWTAISMHAVVLTGSELKIVELVWAILALNFVLQSPVVKLWAVGN